jgi:hypothetical protein
VGLFVLNDLTAILFRARRRMLAPNPKSPGSSGLRGATRDRRRLGLAANGWVSALPPFVIISDFSRKMNVFTFLIYRGKTTVFAVVVTIDNHETVVTFECREAAESFAETERARLTNDEQKTRSASST